MQKVRVAGAGFLLFLISNLCVNGAADKKVEELILGKWKILFDEKAGKDKDVDFFMTFEFFKEANAKMTFTLGEPVIKEETSEGKYRLLDDSTLEVQIAPPGTKESKKEQYKIESITSEKLILRAKEKNGTLSFKRVE
jgi:hypothetical protein